VAHVLFEVRYVRCLPSMSTGTATLAALAIDPGYAPFVFLRNLAPRVDALLGGQMTELTPEISLGLNTKWQTLLALSFPVLAWSAP